MPHVAEIEDIQVGLLEMVTDQIIRNGSGRCLAYKCACNGYAEQQEGFNRCWCGHEYETHE